MAGLASDRVSTNETAFTELMPFSSRQRLDEGALGRPVEELEDGRARERPADW